MVSTAMPHSELELAVVAALLRNLGRTVWLDKLMVLLLTAKVIKSLLFSAVVAALWFRDEGDATARRACRGKLIVVFFAMGVAVFVNQVLQRFFLSPRPVNDARFASSVAEWTRHLVPPDLTSFPSDHVLLFIVVSLGVLDISRRLGALLLLWTLVVVAIPRVYLGIHYPIDILVSIPLGMAAYYGVRAFCRRWPGLPAWVQSAYDRQPVLGTALLFVVLFEVANTFGSSRAAASGVLGLFRPGGLSAQGGYIEH